MGLVIHPDVLLQWSSLLFLNMKKKRYFRFLALCLLSELVEDGESGVDGRSTELLAAPGAPSHGLVRRVGVVLEGHLERHREALEGLAHAVRAHQQVALARLVDRVPLHLLEVRVGQLVPVGSVEITNKHTKGNERKEPPRQFDCQLVLFFFVLVFRARARVFHHLAASFAISWSSNFIHRKK